MKKLLLGSFVGAAMVVAGSVSAGDGSFKLGVSQLDAVSGGSGKGYTEAGGNAGVAHTKYGVEVYSNAYAKGQKSKSYSSQLAVCAGGHCAIAASSGSKAISRSKRGYKKRW